MTDHFKAAPYNPRYISPEALKGLGESLRRFGDLSGIVLNRKTGNLVAGHQRLSAIGQTPQSIFNAAEPWLSGSNVDHVIVTFASGQTISLRIVDWDEPTEKAANVVANSAAISGEWTSDLDEILRDLRCTNEELFEAVRLDELENLAEEPEKPEEFPTVSPRGFVLTCPKCGFGFDPPKSGAEGE